MDSLSAELAFACAPVGMALALLALVLAVAGRGLRVAWTALGLYVGLLIVSAALATTCA